MMCSLTRHRFIQPTLLRRLIRSQPHKHRRSQLHTTHGRLMCPLRKLDLRHNLRTHKLNLLQSAQPTIKRIFFHLQRLQTIKHFLEPLMIKPGPHLTYMHQSLLFVIQAEHKRAKIFAAALRIGVSSDHTLLALRDLDLQPLPRTPLFVTTISFLRDNSFQPALPRRFEKLQTFFEIVIGKVHDLAVRNPLWQQLLSLLEPNASQVETVEIQQIESVISNWHALMPSQTPLPRLESRSLLHQTE